MHDNDDKLRLLPTPAQRHGEYRYLHSFDRGYDDGYAHGQRDGYRQGYADGKARAETHAEDDAARIRMIVTWGLVLAFTVGGVFGVGVCAHLWPLVAAGVLP